MLIAALLVDLQVDFFAHSRLMAHRSMLAANVNELTSVMRGAGHPVIWVTQCWAPDLGDAPPNVRDKGIRIVIDGTPGAALLPELITAPGDYRVVKKRYSPFFGTCLDQLLEELGARRLIIAGVNSHACVRAAITDAYQRDLEVLLASDCIDSYDAEHHEVTMRYLDGRLARAVTNDKLQTELSPISK